MFVLFSFSHTTAVGLNVGLGACAQPPAREQELLSCTLDWVDFAWEKMHLSGSGDRANRVAEVAVVEILFGIARAEVKGVSAIR